MKLNRLVSLAALLALMVTLTVARAQEDRTLVFGWAQPANFPSLVSDAAFAAYLNNFYAHDAVIGAIKYDSQYNPSAYMIEEIPSIENGLVEFREVTGDFLEDGTEITGQAPIVTFSLRPGMVWSDGTPITSADVLFSHNLLTQPDPVDSVQRGEYPGFVESVEVIDELTVRVTFSAPYADYNLLLPGIMPSHKYLGSNPDGWTIDSDGDGVFDGNMDEAPSMQGFIPGETIGYGPYVVTEFVPDTSWTFEVNPNWGSNEWEVVPAFNRVVLQVIQEQEQMQNALQVGDIHVAFNFGYEALEAYEAIENVDTFYNPSVFQDALWINTRGNMFPGFADPEVRQTVIKAINRRVINEQFAPGSTLPTTWYFSSFVPEGVEFVEYDMEAARAELTAKGWVDADGDESADTPNPTPRVSQGVVLPDGTAIPDGTQFRLLFYTTPATPRPAVQQLIQADFAKVGIQTIPVVVPGGSVLFASYNQGGILRTGAFDIAMYALSTSPLSPSGSRDNFWCSGIASPENPNGSSTTAFCDPEYERLDVLQAITTDPAQRAEYVAELVTRFNAGNHWYSIRKRDDGYAFRTDVVDFASATDLGTLSSNIFQNVASWQPAQ